MIDVLILGGTGFPHGEGISETFARRLDPSRFRYRYVDYPAQYGNPIPYDESVAIGTSALLWAIQEAANPVLLAGYSQGAGIAAQVAEQVGAGQHPDLEVVGAALIACPWRPPGPAVLGDPGGYGISGALEIQGMPVWYAAAVRDPITALPRGSMLRSVADLTGYWSATDPTKAVQWAESMAAAVREHRLQEWWSPFTLWDSFGALRQVSAYAAEGRHTDAYITEGHCAALADAVNRVL
ncbi:PE-PPE domain-containing protein [Nocardia vinacea]|uniref:PE-PPE domain-containing protein n=1 Tax=Nocardia vinacea TaxID=96468 RepID=A0ABZ1YLQ7_9NOCA|nr:PE-PPE domain-containing protein [Nocardia vinacea]